MLLKRGAYVHKHAAEWCYLSSESGAKMMRDRGDEEEGFRGKHYVKACPSNSLFKAYRQFYYVHI